MIAVAGHGWSVGIDPDLGGAILYARHDGHDVLRAAPAECTDLFQTGCFPLVPYANRIADGRFEFAGRTHQLPRNFGDHPHSLHGTGWRTAWTLVERSETSAPVGRHDLIDHAWDGVAAIGETRITSDARVMHLYIPPGEDFLCVEPVSHLPDAINRGGMAVLAPGETMAVEMTVQPHRSP